MIDPLSPTPLYRQLADIVIERIRAGDYGTDRPLPSEKDWQQEFGLGRSTVRRAVAVLRDEGWLITAPQRGSWVVPRKVEDPRSDHESDPPRQGD